MNANVAFELSERIPHLGLRMNEHYHRAMVYTQRMKKMGENKSETLYFDLNTGAKIPFVGLGTWNVEPAWSVKLSSLQSRMATGILTVH
ncbi:hypothetical protein TB2_018435 [Malus domestica]